MEYVTYTSSDFFSTVGSYLGLFLGWSLLQMVDNMWSSFRVVGHSFKCCKKDKMILQES
jgi:hypothetical protein